MDTKTIMLVCNAGMSTSMLVKAMKDYAEENNKNYNIFAVSTSKVSEEIETKEIDAILLGPQIRYMEDSIKSQINGIPVQVIDMTDYGTMNAKNVINTAEKLFLED